MTRIFFFLFLFCFGLSGCTNTQQAQKDEGLWRQAQKIHQQAIVFDAHAHGLIFPDESRAGTSNEEVQLTPARMRQGGIDGTGLFFAYHPIRDRSLSKQVKQDISVLRENIRNHAGGLSLCTNIREAVETISAGKKIILPGVEYFYGTFEGDISQVDSLYRYGIRSITLMDNEKDQLMHAWNTSRKVELNTFGRKIIGRMNALGMAIDISHLDDPRQMKVIRYSEAPVMASHSSVRGVHDVPRNVPDSILKALARKDGAIMITFNSGILDGKQKGRTTIGALIDHIDHAVQVAGIDHVGLGSDFNGAGLRSPKNLEDASGFAWITYHLLKRGYKREEIRKILGGNYIRVMREIEVFSMEEAVRRVPAIPTDDYRVLLATKPDLLEATGDNGQTLLHAAVWSNREELVELLLEREVDVHARDSYGRTALMYALQRQNVEITNLLMESGADPVTEDNWGNRPLHIAVNNEFTQGAEILLQHDADINVQNRWGITPLHYALRKTNTALVGFLLDQGADIDLVSNWGMPLQVAIKQGSVQLVKMLINRGTKLNLSNDVGNTPVHTAVYSNEKQILDLLLKHGASLDHFNDLGYGPVHVAAIHGYTSMIRHLKEHGANLLHPDRHNQTPLHYARYYDHPELTNFLGGVPTKSDQPENPGERYAPYPEKLEPGEARVFYTGHSGWTLETQNYYLIFDYYQYTRPDRHASLFNGTIDFSKLMDKTVLVLVTHEHADHYDPVIHQWEDYATDVRYVYGWEAFDEGDFIYFDQPHQKKDVAGVQITNLICDDGGSAFHLQADGLSIFHSGDYTGDLENDMAYLSGLQDRVDMAFVGIDYPEIMEHILRKLHPRVAFPMHKRFREIKYQEYKNKEGHKFPDVQIIPARNKGDRYHYKQGTIQRIDLVSR